jgi:fructuronate reductase
VDEKGSAIDVRDPLAKTLKDALSASGSSPSQRVSAVLEIEAVFGTDLRRSEEFKQALVTAYKALMERGALGAASSPQLAG